MQEVLDGVSETVLCRNTWGDACFAMLAQPHAAVQFALRLLATLMERELPGIRISLHHGIAMELFDPVAGKPNFFGRKVSRAARIEPITPPNCVYASEAFVNATAAGPAPGVKFHYVGRVQLPKNWGEEPLYLVTATAVCD